MITNNITLHKVVKQQYEAIRLPSCTQVVSLDEDIPPIGIRF